MQAETHEKCRDCGDVLGSNTLCRACNATTCKTITIITNAPRSYDWGAPPCQLVGLTGKLRDIKSLKLMGDLFRAVEIREDRASDQISRYWSGLYLGCPVEELEAKHGVRATLLGPIPVRVERLRRGRKAWDMRVTLEGGVKIQGNTHLVRQSEVGIRILHYAAMIDGECAYTEAYGWTLGMLVEGEHHAFKLPVEGVPYEGPHDENAKRLIIENIAMRDSRDGLAQADVKVGALAWVHSRGKLRMALCLHVAKSGRMTFGYSTPANPGRISEVTVKPGQVWVPVLVKGRK
jgi:hypothetical protein